MSQRTFRPAFEGSNCVVLGWLDSPTTWGSDRHKILTFLVHISTVPEGSLECRRVLMAVGLMIKAPWIPDFSGMIRARQLIAFFISHICSSMFEFLIGQLIFRQISSFAGPIINISIFRYFGKMWNNSCYTPSPRRPNVEYKRMVLEHTHGLFIT